MKIFLLNIIFIPFFLNAQTANRFFYELIFKPQKNSEATEKAYTILDITDKGSIYQDYTYYSQDSLISAKIEARQKNGVYYDLSASLKKPSIPYKIIKEYPSMRQKYQEYLLEANFSYPLSTTLQWKILPEKEKIGEYDTQKAEVDFGGRKWTAWFSKDIPFQDGPYKFYGLPGLIVRISDSSQNYSWTLKGNKKIENYSEISLAEKQLPNSEKLIEITPEKFLKVQTAYKKDPLSSLRGMFPEDMMNKPYNDGKTLSEFLKEQEKAIRKMYDNNNPIESVPEK